MKARNRCICNWDECSSYMDMYSIHGNELQKGMLQLRKGNTLKNKEYRRIVDKIFKISNDNSKKIFIANYHWNVKVLSYLESNNRLRTTLLSKEEAKSLNITEHSESLLGEGKRFFALPIVPKNTIKMEIESFTSNRSKRLKRQINSNVDNISLSNKRQKTNTLQQPPQVINIVARNREDESNSISDEKADTNNQNFMSSNDTLQYNNNTTAIVSPPRAHAIKISDSIEMINRINGKEDTSNISDSSKESETNNSDFNTSHVTTQTKNDTIVEDAQLLLSLNNTNTYNLCTPKEKKLQQLQIH